MKLDCEGSFMIDNLLLRYPAHSSDSFIPQSCVTLAASLLSVLESDIVPFCLDDRELKTSRHITYQFHSKSYYIAQVTSFQVSQASI
jgi:hypothetical protein